MTETQQHQQQMRKLWAPQDLKATLAYKFMLEANRKRQRNMQNWQDLHQWSVDHLSEFWEEVFQQYPLIHSGRYDRVVDETARMDSVPPWFEGVKVNFAENVLFWPDRRDASRATMERKWEGAVACTEVREGCTEVRDLTWKEIRERVAVLSNAMRAHGVRKGDRVAVVASNSVDTLTVFYAVTALGGIFSSSSTDMGTRGVLDRLRQIRPKYVFVDDWAVYNGKTIDLRPKMVEIEAGLRDIEELQGLVSMPRWQQKPEDVSSVQKCETLGKFLESAKGDKTLRFERIDFRDPFIIVYSSGTTGMPKCIVHSAGGILLNNRKEGILHRDALAHDPEDSCTLQYTTTGWIMYLSSCMSMTLGSRCLLYDGSPFQPDLKTFVKLVGDQKVTDLGISPRYMQTLATAKPPVLPREVTDLSHLRRVSSTGMVLSEAQFEWFYDQGFPPHVQLGNISGGTDLAACLTMDTVMKPLYCGGTMTAGLGMKVEVYDQEIEEGKGIKGRPAPSGEAGELVCARPFPTMPVMFWGDETGEKYFNAYFGRFENVWTHGDFISVHPQNSQIYLHGRADGVLNPSGVRFGSAEIYNVLDSLFGEEIQDSICVGQRRPQDMDESVMLFLLMKPGQKFTQDLVRRVKDAIAKDVGRRCVPKYVFETPEIPTTINLKKVELPVKQIVSGKTIKPSDTLANKEFKPSPEPPPSPSISCCDFKTTTTTTTIRVGTSQIAPALFNMAAPARYCPSCLSAVGRTSTTSLLHRSAPSVTSSPFQQLRFAQTSQNAQKYKRKDQPASQKKKKTRSTFAQPDLRDAIQFSLVDAMRYLRAAEVGRSPAASKYEVHLRLRTLKNGPVVRNRLRLPHPVKTDLRICVIAPPDSQAARAAQAEGASLVGEENVFDAVKEGRIDFDRCICHQDSLTKLQKSGVARILGPRGLMPSAKTGTVVKDVRASVREMVGASEYRERMGVVRMSVGQLGFTPEEMQRNIRAFVEGVKRDIAGLSDRISKEIHEVVLSSTNGPGMSLNGEMRSAGSVPTRDVSTL
ncbi:acetoacetate-CoA ligase [Hortaea werneckii]|nr:acetoacetate-CoA ligase [Hortaea werneckii]KAI6985760.1 acetoacetate-CoA ligase [Hortaea werneckii]KAI7167048.1 acetoacetate-CoA ligase [Hortaea werneckii]